MYEYSKFDVDAGCITPERDGDQSRARRITRACHPPGADRKFVNRNDRRDPGVSNCDLGSWCALATGTRSSAICRCEDEWTRPDLHPCPLAPDQHSCGAGACLAIDKD